MSKLQNILEKKKKEVDPFANQKFNVDLESLGLDNVEEKSKKSKSTNLPLASDSVFDKTAVKPAQQNQQQVPQKSPQKPLIASEKPPEKLVEKLPKNSSSNSLQQIKQSVDENQDLTSKVSEKKPAKKRLKKPKSRKKKSSKSNLKRKSNRSKNLKKSSEENFDLNSPSKKPVIYDSEITKNEFLMRQRIEELEKLQKSYTAKQLILERGNELAIEDMDIENKIIPKRKNLNSFSVEELPPLPILNRSRSYDNSHIPFVLTPKEKIDIMFSAVSLGSITFFNEAFKDVQNPNIYNDQGDTILTYALLIHKYPVIASVLAKGADPNLPNKLGHKPVGIAIEMIDFPALEMLADNNADLNYVDAFGRTYLMHAARVGFLPAVDLLVKSGVNLNAMDEDGFTALSIAYRHKKELVVQYLLKHGAKPWEEKSFTTKSESLINTLQNRWNR